MYSTNFKLSLIPIPMPNNISVVNSTLQNCNDNQRDILHKLYITEKIRSCEYFKAHQRQWIKRLNVGIN